MKKLAFALSFLALTASAQDYTKLSGHLASLVRQQAKAVAVRSASRPHSILTLMTTTDGRSATALATDYGCSVVDSIGRIYIVDIPLGQVTPMSMDSRVERIEAVQLNTPDSETTGSTLIRL